MQPCPNNLNCDECGGKPAGCEYDPPCDHSDRSYFRQVSNIDLDKNYLCRCEAEAFDKSAELWAMANINFVEFFPSKESGAL